MYQNILGLDPGRDKCGVAVVDSKQQLLYHQVIDSTQAIASIKQLVRQYAIDLIVMGDGTTSKAWQQKIESSLLKLPVTMVNETNSTLEARDRYWIMYPPQGLQRLIPQGLRTPPRPVDDLVAIILIERYLQAVSN
ncbi:resolvase [Pleurocapsa sp. CCALA 161]|uniref:pre-16S rRNA-processing nuclease YqgF n=1 Tax=Pleurocapsa sp. CCALA 161 TaxID=2107688 RepID=UPI000D068518|nr:pre-16S rRNA-processing nuclease YqgF [Pleurocapsa sp. CCALA 161]PSB11967.1 resolvase [Pleurocapsa sp. CCALA 161]